MQLILLFINQSPKLWEIKHSKQLHHLILDNARLLTYLPTCDAY